MTQAIIIDNETHSVSSLSILLQRYCNDSVHLSGCYSSVEDGIKGIKKCQPHLVFIDAGLHQLAGTGMFDKEAGNGYELVMSSGSENLAYHAFQHNALDYLLKPYESELIIRAVKKLNGNKPTDNITSKFEHLLGNIEQLKQYTPPKKIMVPTTNGFELLPVIDILRCQSEINYTTIVMKDKNKMVVAKTLKEFDEMLNGFNFFRVHNSHLINLAYVKSYHKGKGGSVSLIDGTMIEVSTRRKEDFLKKMAEM